MYANGIPTSTLISEYQTYTKNTETTHVANGKARMDYYYMFLMSEANNHVVERTKYGNSVDGQRSYLLPPDYITMKSVRFYSGNQWHRVIECENPDLWHELTAVATEVTIPDTWFSYNEQGNMYMELNGIPNADGSENIEIVYEGLPNRLLFPTDYTAGTIAVNQGSAAVVGTSTTFTSAMVGRFIRPTNGKYWYEIKSYTDATHITLVNVFQEASISGSNYTIAELMRLPAEFSYTPVWGAAMDYWAIHDEDKFKLFEKKYIRDLQLLRDKYQSKSKGAVIPGRRVDRVGRGYPFNYPRTLSTRL